MSGQDHPLRVQLEAMRTAQALAESMPSLDAGTAQDAGGELSLEQLNETERSAATIGVSPDAWYEPFTRTARFAAQSTTSRHTAHTNVAATLASQGPFDVRGPTPRIGCSGVTLTSSG